jgi:hypothetical protein
MILMVRTQCEKEDVKTESGKNDGAGVIVSSYNCGQDEREDPQFDTGKHIFLQTGVKMSGVNPMREFES